MFRPNDGETWRRYANRLIEGFFPERQIIVRTDGQLRYFRLGRNIQLSFVGFLILVAGWTGFSTINVFFHEAIIAEKNNQVAFARLAYRGLLTEVANYQKKFAHIMGELHDSHATMLGLVERNVSLRHNLKTVETQLKSTEQERRVVVGAREQLKRQLAGIETEMSKMATHNFEMKDDLSKYEADLHKTLNERNRLLVESGRMRDSVKRLESRLASLQTAQSDAVRRLNEQALTSIESYESVIRMTGLPIRSLVKLNQGEEVGMGGPFIEADPDDGLPAAELGAELNSLGSKLDRIDILQSVISKVPLSAPLNSYYVSSPFGKRRDPLNKRWAMHYGLDMAGPRKTEVYSTAPGMVTYSGWRGNYGRFIEIDHGSGIKTHYAHLNKILVKQGRKVKFRDKIGLLGSSGRSTGPHLHYEVVFQGKPLNPMKFIEAGRHVFQD